MSQESKHDLGGKDNPSDEADNPYQRSTPMGTAGAVEFVRQPPGGLLAILATYALALAMCVAVQSRAVLDQIPLDSDSAAIFQQFLLVFGVLVIARAWVLAERFFHRGRIWAVGACARLHEAYKENARDESSCCEKDIERFRQRRHDIAEGNKKYSHLRKEFLTSLKFIWLAPFAALSMVTTIAFYGPGVDPASQWGLAALGGIMAVLIMLPVFELAKQLNSSEMEGLSGADMKKIDDENNCRIRDADDSKTHARFYKDVVKAARDAVERIGVSRHDTES